MKKKLFALLLAVVVAVSFAASAMAANVCKEISGSSKSTTTFTVNTGSRWWFNDKLTLTQTKGKLDNDPYWVWDKDVTAYDAYTVTYVNKSTGRSTTKSWKSKNLTLKLDKNTTYEVTIKPSTSQELQLRFLSKGYVRGWATYPTWRVSSTRGIDMCKY